MIQAICFDFNGVIIDDEPLQMQAYKDVLLPYGIQLKEEQYYSALGMDDRTFVKRTFERAGKQLTMEMELAIGQAKMETHRSFIEDQLPLFPGIVTFLKATSRHFSLGIVSMASSEEVGYVLSRARIEHLFSVIVSAEDVNACKPAPDCYQRGLEKLNQKRRKARLLPLLPKEFLVIEDSPPGIESGRAAGMRTLGVTNTVSEEELRAAGAEVVTPSLADWSVDSVRHLFSEG